MLTLRFSFRLSERLLQKVKCHRISGQYLYTSVVQYDTSHINLGLLSIDVM